MKTLYTNGTVVTMDPLMPQAEALVVEGKHIIGLGDQKSMQELAGETCQVIDMQGATLLPGFIESHNHLSMFATFRELAYVGDALCIDDVLKEVAKHYEGKDEEFLCGYSYDDTKLSDGRQITRHDLDKISTEKPVIVYHISNHLGFLNTKALEHFKIDENSVSPVGGEIHFDEEGFPTGRLDEIPWFDVVSQLPAPDESLYVEQLRGAVQEFNKHGITGAHDAGLGLEGAPQMVLDAYKQLEEENDLGVRVFISAVPVAFDPLEPEVLEEHGERQVVFGGVKLFIDGSIQAGTAAVQEPYIGTDNVSSFMMDEDKFTDLVIKYHCKGHHLSIHGNGDAAIELIISSVEKAQKICPRPSRHILVHCQMAHREHLLRMRACGLFPSFFGMHVNNWGDRHRDLFLGEERASRIDPAGEAEQLGLAFGLHVDTPVLKPQVLLSIYTTITRRTSGGRILGAKQCTTQYGAVEAYTSKAAILSRSEDVRGTLSTGKLADMVLLDNDITTCEIERIKHTQVLKTICNGRIVYEA